MATKKPLSRGGSAVASLENQDVNVQVILRCRPPSAEEVAQRVPQVIKCDEANREVTLTQHLGGKQLGRTYHFDKVFAPDTTQEQLYATAVAPIVEEVLQGFNCTIFAYGQTGTGKTHTMTGDISAAASVAEGAGVIPRAIQQIFTHLDAIGSSSEFTVKCCFLELYNEEITDLLAMGNEPPKVRILEDRSGVNLQGLEEPHVKSSADIFGLLETGNARRRTAETLLNKQSSRSHSVFIVTVSVREVLAEGEEVIRVGKLYLVDLAGSENVSRSGAVDQRAKEAGNINKSLLTLGRVITALVEGQGHVPYRDSKLTRLLRDSLGGRTKTCIIATIAPTVQCQEETLSTLDYAHRAKNIKNKPEVNQKISKTTHLKEAAGEIARLKAELMATREKNGCYLPAAQYAEECEERRRLGLRVEELEEDATSAEVRHEEDKAALVAEWEERLAGVQAVLDSTTAELGATRAELAAARQAVAERDFMLQEHRRCEAALAGHANSLTDGLAAAAADVAHLFRRVDAKNGLEDSNLSVIRDLRAAAVERLGALEAGVGAAAAAQAERFAEASVALQALAGRKRSEAEALGEQMAALRGKFGAVGAAAEAAAGALKRAGQAALSSVEQQQAEHLTAAQAAAEQAASALGGAFDALNGSLQEERAGLEALLAGQAAATEAMRGATRTIVDAVQAQLEGARAQAEAAAAAAGGTLEQAAEAAGALEAEFVATARQEQAALVEQVAALVAGFVARAEGQVKGAVAGMKTQLSANQQAMQAQMGALVQHAGVSLEALEESGAAAAAAAAVAAAALHESGSKLGAAADAAARNGLAAQLAAESAASAAVKALQSHSKAVAAAVKKDAKALDATADKETTMCFAAVDEACAAQRAMQEGLQRALTADQDAAAALLSGTAAGTQAVASLAADQQAGLSAVAARVRSAVDEEYRTDGERDAVPTERQRVVPPQSAVDELRAPPAEQLRAQFRAGHVANAVREGCCKGADAAAAAESTRGESNGVMATADENDNPVILGKVAAAALPEAAAAVLSPTGAGQKKRSRAFDSPPPPEQSPSKLRNVFQRSERARRVTRSNAE